MAGPCTSTEHGCTGRDGLGPLARAGQHGDGGGYGLGPVARAGHHGGGIPGGLCLGLAGTRCVGRGLPVARSDRRGDASGFGLGLADAGPAAGRHGPYRSRS